MKQPGNKQYRRKAQSLLASLMYHLAQGPVETEPFTALIQQIYGDIIKANPVNIDLLKNSLAQVQLGKLPKTKRLKRKYAHFLILYQQIKKDREQPSDNPPTTRLHSKWLGGIN